MKLLNLKKLLVFGLLLLMFSSCSISKSALGQSSSSAKNTESLLNCLTAMEGRFEILNLLAGSAFSSDIASELYWKNMFTEDAVFDRGAKKPQSKGLTEILKIVNSTNQQEAIKYGMTHLAMLPHITLKGKTAVATGYLLIVIPDSEASKVKLPGKGMSSGFSTYQITVNRWGLERTAEGWKVTKRTVRPILNADSEDLIRRAIVNNE